MRGPERALLAARLYRLAGLVPLPGRADEKRPDLRSFRQYQADPVPEGVYHPGRWRTPNVMLMCGARTAGRTKVLVVDLDGEAAREHWLALCRRRGCDPGGGAWIARTGGGGWHLYFRLPPGTAACPTRLIWGLWRPGAGWAKHEEIRLLGDGRLAIAPPSLHVESGAPYRWLSGPGPRPPEPPAVAPGWLLDLPACDPGPPAPSPPARPPRAPGRRAPGRGPDRRDVLDRLGPAGKLALAASWGLRLVAGAHHDPGGWVPCHAVDRPDVHPSAAFHAGSGVYHDFAGHRPNLSLFDLAVALGVHRTWLEALEEAARGG